jgi:NTE family protein
MLKKKVTVKDKYQEGREFLEQKKYHEALECFNAISETQANYKEAQQDKFIALSHLAQKAIFENNLEQAEKYLTDAHHIQPDAQQIYEQLASIRHQQYLNETKNKINSSASSSSSSSTKKSSEIKNLVLQGGGIKGIAYLGALQEFFMHIEMASIERVAGTSAGAITALPLALNYSLEELAEIMEATDFTDFMDGKYKDQLLALVNNQSQVEQWGRGVFADARQVKDFSASPAAPFKATVAAGRLVKAPKHSYAKTIKHGLSLLQKDDLGLFPGDFLRENFLEKIIQRKTGIAYLTFAELALLKLTHPAQFGGIRELHVAAVNLATEQTEIFSNETTPDAIVSDAIRLSLSIPLVFFPAKLYIKQNGKRVPHPAGHLYVDGGVLDNYILWVFDKKKYLTNIQGNPDDAIRNPHTVGFRLVTKEKKESTENQTPIARSNPDSLASYVWQLLTTIRHKQESDHNKLNERDRTIYIDHGNVGTVQFDLDEKDQGMLIENGKMAVRQYFLARSELKSENKVDDDNPSTPSATL